MGSNYLDPFFGSGSDTASQLATTDESAPVVINTTQPTGAGQVLVTTSTTEAEWADAPSGGGGDGIANYLAPVDSESTVEIVGEPTAAGQVLTVDDDMAHASWESPSSGGGGESSMGFPAQMAWANPALVDPFDDEFDGGSPDLAVRGWTVRDSTTGVILTRLGPIDVNISPTLGYQSEIVGSRLLFRYSVGSHGAVIYKNVPSIPAQYALRGRNVPWINNSGATASRTMLFLYASFSDRDVAFTTPVIANAVVSGTYSNSGALTFYTATEFGGVANPQNVSVLPDHARFDTFVLDISQVKSVNQVYASEYETGDQVMPIQALEHAYHPVVQLGFIVNTSYNASFPNPGYASIDFIRRRA